VVIAPSALAQQGAKPEPRKPNAPIGLVVRLALFVKGGQRPNLAFISLRMQPTDLGTGMARSKVTRGAASSEKKSAAPTKRSYVKQSDVPIAALEDALRIPRAIFEHYAGKPTAPLQVPRL
jgi:hypothetical protein